MDDIEPQRAAAPDSLSPAAQWLSEHHDAFLVLEVLEMSPEARLQSLANASALGTARRVTT